MLESVEPKPKPSVHFDTHDAVIPPETPHHMFGSTMHQIDKKFGQPSGMHASRPSAPPKAEVNPQNTEAPKNDGGAATAGNDTDDDHDIFRVILQIVTFVFFINCVCCFCRISLSIC